MKNFKEKFSAFAEKLADVEVLQILQKSMTLLTPVTLVGSFFSILAGLPVDAWTNFINSTGLQPFFQWIYDVTYGYTSLILCFGIGYTYANTYGQRKNALSSGVMAMIGFLMLCPVNGAATWTGAQGMFGAIIIGLFTSWVYRIFVEKNIVIKMPAGVPPMVAQAFTAVVPTLVLGLLYCFINVGFTKTSFGSLQDFVYTVVRTPLTKISANAAGELILTLYANLLWMFGIHGGMVAFPIMMVLFGERQAANLAAYLAHEPIPYRYAVGMGAGVGASQVATCVAFIIFSRRKELKEIGKTAVLPSLFQISEPISFGVPLLLNPVFMIPYCFANALCGFLIGHGLQIIGFIGNDPCISVPWVIPSIVSNFLKFGWKGIVAGLIMDVAVVLVYIPFIKIYDGILEKRDAEEAK